MPWDSNRVRFLVALLAAVPCSLADNCSVALLSGVRPESSRLWKSHSLDG